MNFVERLSIFDIYKIGVGPSSSHTLGPWKAALQFKKILEYRNVDKIEIHLYGSLSKTGKGHGTDIALQLGLAGYIPELIDTQNIHDYIFSIKSNGLQLSENEVIEFNSQDHILFHPITIAEHPNTMIFRAFYKDILIQEEKFYSLGGGFVERTGDHISEMSTVALPYPIDTGLDVISYLKKTGLTFSNLVYNNELSFKSEDLIERDVSIIIDTMISSIYRGCTKDGILPGGLNVKRRAKSLNDKLLGDAKFDNQRKWLETVRSSARDFSTVNQWVSCFAIAVNEENASFGRIVTAPTNGAAGVIPAVLMYYLCFCKDAKLDDLKQFLLVSGEIGCIFKKGATISAAVGGCQAEIGVSSAMAAGGLTEILGGTPQQVFMAAEIAMEHHLGLTCDPIGGLVQIPCIERNAMGAIKAITASNLALAGNPEDAIVNFDVVVKTMWDTAQEMNGKYKETSEGGLAFNLPVIIPEC